MYFKSQNIVAGLGTFGSPNWVMTTIAFLGVGQKGMIGWEMLSALFLKIFISFISFQESVIPRILIRFVVFYEGRLFNNYTDELIAIFLNI